MTAETVCETRTAAAAIEPRGKKRRRSERIQRWRDLEFPVGGFGAGGDWKRRASSGEATAYEIDTELGLVRRRGAEEVTALSKRKEYVNITLSVLPEKGFQLQKCFQLHSLVCWAAHGPMPRGCSSVDHIDRDPKNNADWNLRWASAKEQASNKNHGKRKAMLPFVRMPDEEMHEFRGFPGFAYAGPSLVITTAGRIVRSGKLSQAESLQNGYPVIAVKGLGMKKMHRIAWSAYYGADAAVPEVINHRDGNTENFAKANLEKSDSSHNRAHAHDIGSYDGGKRQRQPVVLRLTSSETGEVWQYDGVNDAEFPSQHAAARALVAAGVCALADVRGSINSSISKKCSFAVLVGGVPARAWAFRA